MVISWYFSMHTSINGVSVHEQGVFYIVLLIILINIYIYILNSNLCQRSICSWRRRPLCRTRWRTWRPRWRSVRPASRRTSACLSSSSSPAVSVFKMSWEHYEIWAAPSSFSHVFKMWFIMFKHYPLKIWVGNPSRRSGRVSMIFKHEKEGLENIFVDKCLSVFKMCLFSVKHFFVKM